MSLISIVSCNTNKQDSHLLSADDSVNVENYLKQSNQYLLTDKGRAGSFAQQALLICIGKNNNFLKAKTYIALTAAQRYNTSMDSLFKNDKKAILFARASNDTAFILNALYNYANDLIAFSELKEAKKIIDTSMQFSAAYKNDTFKSKELYTLGLFSFKLQSDPNETENLFQQSLSLANKLNNAYLAANDKLWIFETHIAKGQFDSTVKLAFEALDFFQKNNYREDVANAKMLIGDSYKNQGNTAKSIEFLSASYTDAVASENYIIVLRAITLLDYDYFVNNDLNAIAKSLPDLNKYADSLASPFFTATAKGYAGRYYSLKGNYDTARSLFHETEKLADDLGAYKLLGMGYIFESESFAKQNKNDAADSLEAKAYAAIQKGVSKELIEKMYVTSSDTTGKNLNADSKLEKRLYTDSAFAASAKGRQAIKTLRHGTDTIETRPVISVFDSSISVVYNDQLVGYETQYKTKQKEDSLRIQKQQTIIAQEKIKKQNLIISSIAIIALLLAAGFFLQYKNKQRALKDKAKIELLQHEIHHRVKNNLGIIKRFVEVAEKSGAQNLSLASLQNRIAAIELLHKNLYQSVNTGEVSLQTYLEQLVKIINSAFGENEENIAVNVNAPVKTNMATAEKIGLLINELLTNSFKYGFKNKTAGEINITANQINRGKFTLNYKENGVGYKAQAVTKGYGSKLIEGIANELKAAFELNTENGVDFKLTV